MAGVGQGVEGCLLLDLLEGADGVVHRDVEGVGVVLPVGDAGDFPKLFLVDADKAAGQAFGGSGQQGEVQARLLGLVIHALAHVGDDLIAQLIAFLTLAVMLAGQGHQRLCQADEAHGEGAVLQHFGHRVVAVQLFRINPNPLPHQEGVVVSLFAALDLEPVQQLLDAQVNALIQDLVESLDIFLGLNADAGQVDGGKTQVAPAAGHLAVPVVDVAHHTGAASHVGHLGVVIAGLVILQVERGVQKAEVGEQPLGGDPHGQLEQVVVGVALVVVDALLHLEDLHREDRGLPVAQAGLGGQQQVADDHPALLAGVGAVVQRAEGHLGPSPGVHGVQVVHQGLHGLVGGVVRLPPGGLFGVGGGVLRLLLGDLLEAVLPLVAGEVLGKALTVLFGGGHGHLVPQVGLGRVDHGLYIPVGHGLLDLQKLHQGLEVLLAVGLVHALGHGVVENRHALAAVHLVLVGLDGDAGQSGVAADVVGLPQVAVAGGKAVVEQLDQVDLAAGLGKGVEVLVVDVDLPVGVGLGDVGRDDVLIVEALGPLRAVLQHGAHGGVGVDVGVLPL